MDGIQSKKINDCVLLIPALNPEEKFIDLLEVFAAHFRKIILVDDGSTGEGKEVFRRIRQNFSEENIHIVTHEKNAGKGVALKTGYKYYLDSSMAQEFIGIVTADSDGQHNIKDIMRLCGYLQDDHENVIHLGVRDLKSDIMPSRSKFGNNSSAFLFSFLYGIKLSDTQSGLRAFSNDILPWISNVRGKRFEYEMNTLIQTKSERVRIVEHTIDTVYEQNHKSTFRTIRDSILVFFVLFFGVLQFAAAGIISAVVDIAAFYFLYNYVFLPITPEVFALLYATITARVLSSIVNFVMNRFVTFGKKKMNKTSILRYYIVWAIQMGASYGIVFGFTTLIGGGELWIKILCDFALMVLSFQVQMRWVFNAKKEKTLE